MLCQPLTILIRLLVADFGAQQTPHLSLGLTEAQTCKFRVFWVETWLMSEYLRCLTLAILMRTALSLVNLAQAAVVGGAGGQILRGRKSRCASRHFSVCLFVCLFVLLFYVGKPC